MKRLITAMVLCCVTCVGVAIAADLNPACQNNDGGVTCNGVRCGIVTEAHLSSMQSDVASDKSSIAAFASSARTAVDDTQSYIDQLYDDVDLAAYDEEITPAEETQCLTALASAEADLATEVRRTETLEGRETDSETADDELGEAVNNDDYCEAKDKAEEIDDLLNGAGYPNSTASCSTIYNLVQTGVNAIYAGDICTVENILP